MARVRDALAPELLDPVFEDPEFLRALVEREAPYAPVQRYFQNEAQSQASGAPGGIIAPNFRGDWAYDEPRVEGAATLLHHPGFIDAARRIFDAEVVRPQQVYANLTWQLPFPQGPGHTDVPAFRGVDRTRVATPLLQLMNWSGLFERWRIDIATAVSWWYRGEDGGFDYWPEGPDGVRRVHEGQIFNTAIVGDNDFMFHRVRPVGRPERGLPRGLSLDSRLEWLGGDAWQIRDGDDVIGEPSWDELRISVSWKANVFASAEAARIHDEHLDDLSLERVFERFYAELDRRGVAHPKPAAPADDAELFGILAGVWPSGTPVHA